MVCKNCGKELYTNQKFCVNCGWKIQNNTEEKECPAPLPKEETDIPNEIGKEESSGKTVVIGVVLVILAAVILIVGRRIAQLVVSWLLYMIA